jgi:hypothetical protein
LYERARTALVTQLRGVAPALNESDITRERLALEEAIRKAEAEAARKSRFDPPPERRRTGELDEALKPAATPRAPAPPAESRGNGSATPAPGPEALAEALMHPSKEESRKESRKEPKKEAKEDSKEGSREESQEESKDDSGDESKDESKDESLSGTAAELRRAPRTPASPRFNEGLKGFRDVVADAENLGQATAEGARSARQAYNAMPSPSSEFERIEPRLEPEGLRTRDRRPPSGRDPVSKREPSPRENGRKPRDSAPRERMPLGRDTDSHDADPRASNSREMSDFDMPSRIEPMRGNDFSPRDFGPVSDFGGDAESGMPHDGARMAARSRADAPSDEEDVQSLPLRRPRGRFMTYAAVALGLVSLAAVLVWQWQPMVAAVRGLAASRNAAAPTAPNVAAPARPKITDRIGANDAPAPGPQAAADVAQRVVLYEEDPADPAGKRYVGSSVWRTESVAAAAGQPPETVVRADIEIPERKLTMKWSLRRNLDKTLPASHTVEVVFTLPADFPHGGIQNIPGVLMKQSEQTRGVPLAGLAVKVTNGFFLIGLSAVDSEMQRNLQLLKERPWFDVPVVYNDGRRAILAVEKGTPGERAFATAFAAWKQ